MVGALALVLSGCGGGDGPSVRSGPAAAAPGSASTPARPTPHDGPPSSNASAASGSAGPAAAAPDPSSAYDWKGWKQVSSLQCGDSGFVSRLGRLDGGARWVVCEEFADGSYTYRGPGVDAASTVTLRQGELKDISDYTFRGEGGVTISLATSTGAERFTVSRDGTTVRQEGMTFADSP
ncbi:hypothetical protein [Luteipulveratus halotolerans]|uniref:hypothetical protein n=1 Tax=Luteipulveratus halotolerans TaxID=1631356 RepID=UPI00068110BF|nr:hypothetical protein [Luteipulveratus halotolerans]